MDVPHTSPQKSAFKLHPSRRLIPAKGNISVRPKVKEAIEQGLDRSRLLFACAPKGYGKSLAVSAYARSVVSEGGMAEWVELSREGESTEDFLCYLLDAIKELLGLPEASMSETYKEIAFGWRDALETFLLGLNKHSIQNSSSERKNRPDPDKQQDREAPKDPTRIMVINGWDGVNSSKDQRFILETLIRFTPAELKILVISSKLDEALINSPVMINIQPQLMLYIDFSMGYTDVVRRLQQFNVVDAEDRAHFIMQRTLGWPLAVELMVKDVSMPTTSEAYNEPILLSRLSSFLSEQFNLPKLNKSAHILAVLSLVERISEQFCRDVFGEEGEVCFAVLKEQLILQSPPEGANTNYYLFNPVYRSWLVETHLKALTKEDIEPWIVKSSEWFVQHQAFSEAIHLCTYLGKADVILSVAEQSCDFLLQQHGFHQLKKLETQLSESVIESSAKLRASIAWAWAYSMDFNRAIYWLDSISAEQAAEVGLTPLVVLIRAWCARYQGEYELTQELLAKYKTFEDAGELTGAMYRTLSARIAMATGDSSLGEQRINENLRKARNWSDGRLESAVLIDLCRFHQQRGDWHSALASIDKGIALLYQQTLGTQSPFYGRMMMLKSYILWIQGDWINAEDVCDRGIKTALHNEDPMIVLGFSVKALLHRGKRSFRKAHRGIFELERLMHCWNVPDEFYQPLITLVKAFLKLDEGQVNIAENLYAELMDQNYWHPALSEWLPHLEYYLDLLGIRLQCHHQEWAEALESCETLNKKLTEESRPIMHIPVMVLQATCYDSMGESRQGSKVLKRALQESMNCNYIAPFMELGGQVAPMLAKLNERGELGEFIYRLQHLEGLREHLSIGNDACVPLSDREQGVLVLIAEGHSNQSVADKLFISLNTVKTHARKINTKLGVKNRTQAIAKARELGLL